MGQHGVAVTGGDEFFGRSSVETGQWLMLEPDDRAPPFSAEQFGRRRDNAGDVAEPFLDDRLIRMLGEGIAMDFGQARNLGEGHMKGLAHALRRDKAAAPVGHLVEESAEHVGPACALYRYYMHI